MPDILKDPVRKIALPFAGDPWAQPGAQVPIPDDVQRLTITSAPFRIRVVGYTGTGASAVLVDGSTATYDWTVVKLRPDRSGNVTLARTVPVTVTTGGEVPVGDEQQTEEDVSPVETVCIGIPSVTTGNTAAIRIFVDAGAKYTTGSNGTA